MKEIICIFIGQFGVNVGQQFWEQFCFEQYIDLSGNIITSQQNQYESYLQPFFYELSTGQMVPRSIIIDLDPTQINKVKTGNLKNLFNANSLISGKCDASNVFVLGMNSDEEIYKKVQEQIRKYIEQSENFQGFMIFTNLCGGTGSGFSYELLSRFNSFLGYDKYLSISFLGIPSNNYSSNCIEPYNFAYSIEMFQYSDNLLNILFQNESISKYCTKYLGIDSPTFYDLNQQIVKVASQLTSNIRFGGSSNYNFDEISQNIKPNNQINLAIPSYYSIKSSYLCENKQSSINQLSQMLFNKDTQFVDCQTSKGKTAKCSFTIRGDIDQKIFYSTTEQILEKRINQFTRNYPFTIKMGISNQKYYLDNIDTENRMMDGLLVQMNSQVHRVLQLIYNKYNKLHYRGAYHYWFNKYGLDKDFRRFAGRNLESYITKYKELYTYDDIDINNDNSNINSKDEIDE